MGDKDKKILVVDDEKDILEFCKLVLSDEEYEVECVLDAKKGLEKLTEFKPDLILLDIMMPEVDGWEFMRILRNDEGYKNIPIAMLTAKVQPKDQVMGIQEGADDYITKPFSPTELVERVSEIFKSLA